MSLPADPRTWDLQDVVDAVERVVARGVAQELEGLPARLRLALQVHEFRADLDVLLDKHQVAIAAKAQEGEAEDEGRFTVLGRRTR